MKARAWGGFIVICGGAIMRIHAEEKGTPPGGVLVFGDSATLFRTRGRARKAVERTVRYAREHGFPWPILDETAVTIRPVRAEA